MASSPARDADVIQLAYEHAIQALAEQRGTVDELRGRAGTLLGAASIASSFLGGFALADRTALTGWAILAIAAFVVLGALVFAILWPYHWQFGFDPHLLVRDYVDAGVKADDGRRDLAIYAGDYLNENDRRLLVLWWLYRIATIALVALIAFWLFDLGGVASE